jgi:protocatechuate 3,4-dioxygenase beta subunit
VRKQGLATVVFDFPAFEHERMKIDFGEVVLPASATLLGRLVDERGHGVSGIEVSLRGANADRYRMVDDPAARVDNLASNYVDLRRTTSDSGGRFSFSDLPGGTFELRAARRGSGTECKLEIMLEQGELRRGIELVMLRGATILGRVVSMDGKGLPRIHIRADAPNGGTRASTSTEADGSFELSGLEVGAYDLRADYFPRNTDDPLLLAPARVTGVETGARDLVVQLRPGVRLRGVLVNESGTPIRGGWVRALESSSASTDIDGLLESTDGNGRFEFVVAADATIELKATRPGEPITLDAPTLATVESGVKEVQLELPPASPSDE